MSAETHFVQACDGPVFIGPGSLTLSCACGATLVEGYDPARFLAVGFQCGHCKDVTVTPGLAQGASPPSAVIVAEAVAEERLATTTLPETIFVIGRVEMDRITALLTPRTPAESVYRFSQPLLDEAEAAYARYLQRPLPDAGGHALGMAVAHLRGVVSDPAWTCLGDSPSGNAVTHVAGFLHFVATWSQHPLFAAMARAADERGFSLHGLAPFAAAHCLSMAGNRLSFTQPIGDFHLATGPVESVLVRTEVFGRFEYPSGAAWDPVSLRAAVAERIAAVQGTINLKRPGILVLSAGAASDEFDKALVEAIHLSVLTLGRKNRGLMAAAPILLRLQPADDARSVRFGYVFVPVSNKHFRGDSTVEAVR